MKNAEHVLVAGPSGGGKTTYLGEMHSRAEGPTAYLSTANGDTYPEDIQRVRDHFIDLGGGQVIVDECQNAPTFLEGADGPVRKMLHEDRKRGIKAVVATQNPQDLRTREYNYGPLQQCEYFVWVGQERAWHDGFTDWLKLRSEDLPDQPYAYVVLEPTNPPQVVAEGTTDPQYHPGG